MLFAYDISMGVRKGETEQATKLEKSIERQRGKIEKILSAYHIPVIDADNNSLTTQSSANLIDPLKK